MNEHTPYILVTGATGKTGRRVMARLAGAQVRVRPASRSASTPFDWQLPTTWAGALRGIDGVYLAYAPDTIMPGAVDTIDAFCRAAVAAGVERVVLLAGRGEEEAMAAERVVRDSGMAWTVVRASWFAQNFSEDYLYEPVLEGVIALPAGDVSEPFVDVDDIADVATAALLDERHHGHTYDVTGPRLLTFAEAAATIGEASGRQIDYVDVTPADYLADALAHGVPDDLARALTDLFARVLDGRNQHVGTGVADAIGRAPRDFTDYARRVAATGVWQPATVR